jgi:hypothetical protein
MTDPFSYRVERPSQAGQAPPEEGETSRSGSLDDLAKRLDARQRERESRYRGAPQPDQAQAPLALGEGPTESFEDQPAASADDLGPRFGWEDRWAEDEVRRHFEAQNSTPPKRWGGWLLRAGGVLGVSAVVAFFIVFPGGAPQQSASNGNSAPEVVADEGVASTEGGASSTNDATLASAGEATTTTAGVPSAPMPAREAEATTTTATVPSAPDTPARQRVVTNERLAFGDDSIRTVLPAPQQTRAETEDTRSDAASVDGGAEEAGMQRSIEAESSWIAPVPQSGSGDGATADAADETTPGTDDVVEAGADPSRATGDDVPVAEEPAPATASAANGQSAQVTADVNLRDQPDNDGTVLGIVPADATVDLLGCDIWCEVVHDGRQGWVYRDFVTGAEQAASAQ